MIMKFRNGTPSASGSETKMQNMTIVLNDGIMIINNTFCQTLISLHYNPNTE